MSTQTIGVTNQKPPYFETTVSADVDVEISPAELHDKGWHHENECGSMLGPLVIGGYADARDVVASLRRQAHPGQPADPVLCREEPCRSVSADSLRRPLGRAS